MRSLLLFLLSLGALRAHEIGTTRVAVSFPEPGAYLVEIVTDREALQEKWKGGEAEFLSRVELRFDGDGLLPSHHRPRLLPSAPAELVAHVIEDSVVNVGRPSTERGTHGSQQFCAIERVTISRLPPAASGMIRRTGFCG